MTLFAQSDRSTLTELQTRKLMKLFSMDDADNTGVLKIHNFQTLVDRLAAVRNWKPDSQEYIHLSDRFMHRWLHIRAEIKDKLPGNREGHITPETWLLFYERVLSDPGYLDHISEIANSIFDAVDVDASGNLNLQEWQDLFQA